MMNTERYYENGMNVHYIKHFIEKSKADFYLEQLKKLSFYTPTFNNRDKAVQPKRQILAYGDENVSYALDDVEVPGEPWSPLLLELRDHVEKHLGCTYNYVLLNYYPDGASYSSHHKDNESSLDMTFPIAVLSFGETRTLEFKKPECESTCIDLHHGSLYTMMKPTNEQFSHGITPNSSVKTPCISLTFRHVLCKPHTPPLKKPRLVLDESSESNETYELPQNDWLVKLYQRVNPVMLEWCLNWNTYVQIVLENNVFLRLHIRNFKERVDGQRYPTKKGVVMTSVTWEMFQNKILDFNFNSVSDSLIANNQLFVAYLDSDYCLFQQIFKTRNNGFYFKPDGLKLSLDQFLKLKELRFQISEGLIEIMLTELIQI